MLGGCVKQSHTLAHAVEEEEAMRAAVLYEVGAPLAIEELTLLPPKEGEVRVRFAASGVCHSDLHYIKGDRPYPKPVVLGHEGAGIVEEVGPGVTRAKAGDHVILSFVPACGRWTPIGFERRRLESWQRGD